MSRFLGAWRPRGTALRCGFKECFPVLMGGVWLSGVGKELGGSVRRDWGGGPLLKLKDPSPALGKPLGRRQ